MAGIVLFGVFLFRRRRGPELEWESFLHRQLDPNKTPVTLRYLAEAYGDFLQRRNDFWTVYGQVPIAALIIIVLTILLLTKTISAEAGLPLLSGISGFAIAKEASAGGRSSSGPPGGD